MPTIPHVATLAALALATAASADEARWLDQSEAARYGRRIVEETFAILGPAAPDAALRFAGNSLACGDCHAAAGTRPDALPLAGAYAAYPAYQARSGTVETIEDRIDDCMVRSMNGRPLPQDGREMQAIVAYLRFLDEDAPDFERPAPAPHDMPCVDAGPFRLSRLLDGSRVEVGAI